MTSKEILKCKIPEGKYKNPLLYLRRKIKKFSNSLSQNGKSKLEFYEAFHLLYLHSRMKQNIEAYFKKMTKISSTKNK